MIVDRRMPASPLRAVDGMPDEWSVTCSGERKRMMPWTGDFKMLGPRLLQLIQAHAGPLTRDVVKDVRTSERTPTFRRLDPADVETRIAALFYNLGKWLGDADETAVAAEYEDMGRARFREGVRVSELVYALLISKHHLRRYIREHGLVDFVGDRIASQELLPVELHSIQELNYQVGEFFDRALYHLVRGYESEAAARLEAV